MSSYQNRTATSNDSNTIAPFVTELCKEWATIDPTRKLKPDFDWQRYTTYLLNQPHTYCILLEHTPDETPDRTTIVGCIVTNFFDESPTPNAPPDQLEHHAIAHPFQPRRIGTVMGFYIQPEHRKAKNVIRLIEAAIDQAFSLEIDTIDVQVFSNRTGIQAYLKRRGFQASNTQYLLSRSIPTGVELPNLHSEAADLLVPDYKPEPQPIPLRDPQTGDPVHTHDDRPALIYPLTDDDGNLRLSSQRIPIYPPPVRDPQADGWVFDNDGELVVCPAAYDDSGEVIERDGVPQFRSPEYAIGNGEAKLVRTPDGSCVFRELEPAAIA
jgi:hypothetical protein